MYPPSLPLRPLGIFLVLFAFVVGMMTAAHAYTRALEPFRYAERTCNPEPSEREWCIEREMNERVEPWMLPLAGGCFAIGLGSLIFAVTAPRDRTVL